MKIVVTGASGFIGRHLVAVLRMGADQVVPVSRSPVPGGVQVASYAETPGGDVLVHLADTRTRAVTADQVGQGVEGLDALLAKGYGRVVYASSAAVYGDALASPRHVDETVVASDPYSAGKIAGEARALAGGAVVARLANVFGPGQAPESVLSQILAQVPGEGPVQLQDDGPVRDFVWVGDVVDALARLTTVAPVSHILNVGSGTGTSVGQLARTVLRAAGQPDRPVVAKCPSGRPSCIVLDVAATMAQLSWRPRTTLVEGIKKLLAARDA